MWYRFVAKDAATKEWELIKDNQVKVLDTVTDTSKGATLTYTAYAIQANALQDVAYTEAEGAAKGWELLNTTP